MAAGKSKRRKTGRSEPLVWISRIALFESLDPPVRIREPITFTTGLNIVQGIEDESNSEHFEPGHGVGKTTLCRLIRYCLGEPSFGQEHAAKEIRHTFRDGYVAAEIHLHGRMWSILRPFHRQNAECAQVDVSIDELIAKPQPKASFAEYLEALSKICVSGFRTDAVLPGGASIEWGHLLAMCTRDQEARYQTLWQWRVTRSASGSPRIQRDDAMLTLRSMLNLLPDEETELQKLVADAEQELNKTEKKITDRQKEPEFRINLYRQSLHDDCQIDEALDAPIESQGLFDLPSLVKNRVSVLDAELKKLDEESLSLARRIAVAAAGVASMTPAPQQTQVAAEVTETRTRTTSRSLEDIARDRDELSFHDLSLCVLGGISIGDCSYVQQRLVKLNAEYEAAKESSTSAPVATASVASELSKQASQKSDLVAEQLRRLKDATEAQQAIDKKRADLAAQIKSVKSTIAKLSLWERLRTGKQPDSELATLAESKARFESSIKNHKDQLANLLEDQNEQLKDLRTTYAELVRKTLSRDFNGRVTLTSTGLEFRVFRGENLSGEAFETLSILLADLAVLIMGARGMAHHPGLLIHDSPREADLGSSIYRRLFLVMAATADDLTAESTSPFQYIVTTTTPPPTELTQQGTIPFLLGSNHGPLFGKQLHVADTQHDIAFEPET